MDKIKYTKEINCFDEEVGDAVNIKHEILHNKFQEANLMNDILFGIAMKDDDFCRIVLSIILGEEIVQIVHKETQSTLQGLPGYKSVRLDVFAVDANGVTYNVEIQNSHNDNMPKRARFYQGILDVNTLFAGKDHKFSELPKNYIIFITDFDCFGKDFYQYTFTNKCNELLSLELDDGATKIFLNTRGKIVGETRPELIQFLKLVKKTAKESIGNYKDLEHLYNVVNRLKGDKEKEAEFMKLEWQKEAGREEGIEKGREEAKKVFKLSLSGNSQEEIALKLGMNLEEVKKILE